MAKKIIDHLPKIAILIIIASAGIFLFIKSNKVTAETNIIGFTQEIITNVAVGAERSIAVDMDNDTDMDVLTTILGGTTLTWYKNDGHNNFTPHFIYLADHINDLYTEDIDNDGDIDILTIHRYGLLWHENDGNENFIHHGLDNSYNYGEVVRAEDIDGDGDMDIIAGVATVANIYWYENDGSQHFTRHSIPSATKIINIFPVDIDGDGDLDLTAITANYDGAIYWYENDGSQHFTPHSIASNGFTRGLYITDLDNDNDADIITARVPSGIYWYENDGSQNFTIHSISNSNYANSIYAADIDGDQHIDLVKAYDTNNEISWYRNDGSQNFTENIVIGGFKATYIANMDSDDDIDILAISSDGSTFAWYQNDLQDPVATCNDGVQNGDETGVDCGGSCQYSCTVPIILVHGYTQDWEDIGPLMTLLDDRLDSNDHPIYALDYAPGQCTVENKSACTIGNIKTYAKKLSDNVEYVKKTHNARYVDIVGYSMGGLISRWYVQTTDTNKVRYLIQLATPNHGMPTALRWMSQDGDIIDRALPGFIVPNYIEKFADTTAAKQMYNAHTNFMKDLNGGDDYDYENVNSKVSYAIAGGTKGDFLSQIIWPDDDGVVSTNSLAIYNSSVSNILGPVLGYYNHGEIYKRSGVADFIANIILGTYSAKSLTEPQQALDVLTEDTQEISYIEDSVVGQKSHTVNLNNENYVYFLMSYDGDYTDLTIESPDSTIYNTEATSTMRYLQINNPLAGEWTLTASSTNASYHIYTFVKTDVLLETTMESIVAPGQDILISATLTASSTPLTGADVTAQMIDNQDNQYTLNLIDQGDGTYSNTFSQTSNLGYYDVNITASTTIAGLNINRNAYDIFEAIDYPDLRAHNMNAVFNNANYEVTLSADVENLENVAADDFTLRFYNGYPGDVMSIMIKEIDFSLGALRQAQFTATTTPDAGQQVYYVSILKYNEEDNYDNNDDAFSLEIPAKCSDGTNPNQCSTTKPLYCADGELINNCQTCGCPGGNKCSYLTGACVPYSIPYPYPHSEANSEKLR
ncbi:alpha/beta fold hydrolase [Patescibacteria group bacterium]|nr:alpha/beta fold hydrolase [Patescibacteria group bacterium]